MPPFSGFFSKDEILLVTGEEGGWHWALYVFGYVGAFMTAIYTFRMIFRTFHGEPCPRRPSSSKPATRTTPPCRSTPPTARRRTRTSASPGPTHAIAETHLPMKVAMSVLAVGAAGAGLVQIPERRRRDRRLPAPELRDLPAL